MSISTLWAHLPHTGPEATVGVTVSRSPDDGSATFGIDRAAFYTITIDDHVSGWVIEDGAFNGVLDAMSKRLLRNRYGFLCVCVCVRAYMRPRARLCVHSLCLLTYVPPTLHYPLASLSPSSPPLSPPLPSSQVHARDDYSNGTHGWTAIHPGDRGLVVEECGAFGHVRLVVFVPFDPKVFRFDVFVSHQRVVAPCAHLLFLFALLASLLIVCYVVLF